MLPYSQVLNLSPRPGTRRLEGSLGGGSYGDAQDGEVGVLREKGVLESHRSRARRGEADPGLQAASGGVHRTGSGARLLSVSPVPAERALAARGRRQ